MVAQRGFGEAISLALIKQQTRARETGCAFTCCFFDTTNRTHVIIGSMRLSIFRFLSVPVTLTHPEVLSSLLHCYTERIKQDPPKDSTNQI
jgi:hypothetical protein